MCTEDLECICALLLVSKASKSYKATQFCNTSCVFNTLIHPPTLSLQRYTQSRACTMLFGKIKLPQEWQADSHTNQALSLWLACCQTQHCVSTGLQEHTGCIKAELRMAELSPYLSLPLKQDNMPLRKSLPESCSMDALMLTKILPSLIHERSWLAFILGCGCLF